MGMFDTLMPCTCVKEDNTEVYMGDLDSVVSEINAIANQFALNQNLMDVVEVISSALTPESTERERSILAQYIAKSEDAVGLSTDILDIAKSGLTTESLASKGKSIVDAVLRLLARLRDAIVSLFKRGGKKVEAEKEKAEDNKEKAEEVEEQISKMSEEDKKQVQAEIPSEIKVNVPKWLGDDFYDKFEVRVGNSTKLLADLGTQAEVIVDFLSKNPKVETAEDSDREINNLTKELVRLKIQGTPKDIAGGVTVVTETEGPIRWNLKATAGDSALTKQAMPLSTIEKLKMQTAVIEVAGDKLADTIDDDFEDLVETVDTVKEIADKMKGDPNRTEAFRVVNFAALRLVRIQATYAIVMSGIANQLGVVNQINAQMLSAYASAAAKSPVTVDED